MTWYRWKNSDGKIVEMEVNDKKAVQLLEIMFNAKRVQPPQLKPPSTKRPSLAVASIILLAVVLALVGGGIWLQQSAQKAASPSSNSPSSSSQPSSGSGSDEAAVEDAIKGHYAAIGAGDFEKAYSYFGPTLRNQVPEQGWIDSHRADQIRGTNINSLKVNSVSGNQATATVDVTSQDKTGAPRFLLPWNLVKENGQWKLDNQVGGQRIA